MKLKIKAVVSPAGKDGLVVTDIEGDLVFTTEDLGVLAFVQTAAAIGASGRTTPREGPNVAISMVEEMVKRVHITREGKLSINLPPRKAKSDVLEPGTETR